MSDKMERTKDEITGGMLYGPSMPGAKPGQAIPYLFDAALCRFASRKTHGGIRLGHSRLARTTGTGPGPLRRTRPLRGRRTSATLAKEDSDLVI